MIAPSSYPLANVQLLQQMQRPPPPQQLYSVQPGYGSLLQASNSAQILRQPSTTQPYQQLVQPLKKWKNWTRAAQKCLNSLKDAEDSPCQALPERFTIFF